MEWTGKTKTWLAALVLVAVTGVALAVWLVTRSEEANAGQSARVEAQPEQVYYTCPMHPTVVQEHPGDCPICGMQLVKKVRATGEHVHGKTENAGTGVPGPGTGIEDDPGLLRIAISPTQRVLANIATIKVSARPVGGQLETVGRIAFAESSARTISATVSGRVEELALTYTGQAVSRGQSMLRIYSPELLTAEEEYLSALNMRTSVEGAGRDTKERTEALIAAAEQRLKLLGLSPDQIRATAARGTSGTSTVITAPFSGTVLQKLVQTGQYVAQGQPLYTVAPLGQVWVLADVYEQDLRGIRVGTTLSVPNPAAPGQRLNARVDFISPTVDPATRTATVRANLPNAGGLLKPGMFVQVQILGTSASGTSGMAVPASALMESGRETVVWVEVEPGLFEPREITVGARSGDWVEVLSGLSEGESVAVTGTFLLDSEAQLRRGATGHEHGS